MLYFHLVPIPWTNYSDKKRISDTTWSIETFRVSRAIVFKIIKTYKL